MKYPPRYVSVEHLNWLHIIFSTELPANSKLIASYLNTYMNAARHEAWPGLNRIATECSLNKKTVIKYLEVLITEGWLVKKKGGVFNGKNTPNHYMIGWPKGIETTLLNTKGGSVPDTPPPQGGSVPSTLGVVYDVHHGSVPSTPKYEKEYEIEYESKESGGKKRFAPPTRYEVESYMVDKGATFEQAKDWSEDFIDFYESKGWMVGKNKMKSWANAASRWTKKNISESKATENGNANSKFGSPEDWFNVSI